MRAAAAPFTVTSPAGVSLPPSVYEAWFVSAAHDERAIERVLAAAVPAAKAAAAATPSV